MELPIRLIILIELYALLVPWTLATVPTAMAANQSMFFYRIGNNQRLRTLYPSSTADLIVNYFQNYKHIKQLTLLLCDERSSSAMVPLARGDDVAGDFKGNVFARNDAPSHTAGDRRQIYATPRHLNIQQIVKQLMATGNFLIKGDANVDAKKFRDGDPFYLPDMLKCGDFKLGVVLDLRCRQSKFIFQQVTVSHQ